MYVGPLRLGDVRLGDLETSDVRRQMSDVS